MTVSSKAMMALAAAAALSACTLSPDPVTDTTMDRLAKEDLRRLRGEQPMPATPITLHEAMARALLFNRDRRVESMSAALEKRQHLLANFDMLPELTADAGYSNRSNESGSSSKSLLSGTQSLEPSTSQDKESYTGSLGVMWNVLDFGVSYVRAGQQGDRFLAAKERERRVTQTLIEDVRAAYWRALSAQKLLDRIPPLVERAETALVRARTAEERRVEAPVDALSYQRDLLDSLRGLMDLRRDLEQARVQLATLIGLPPGTDFTLAEPDIDTLIPPKTLSMPMEQMERLALANRPETRQAFYEKRIAGDEITVAALSMLPGIDLNYGWNFDSNSFLYNASWFGYGAAISWNLFRVFTGPFEIQAAQAGEDVAEERRLAVAMTVLAQVHLAQVDFHQAQRDFDVANRYATVTDRLSDRVEAQARARRVGEREAIRESLNALLGQVRRDVAFARLRTAYGRIFTSMGADPMPESISARTVPGVAQALETRFDAWDRGHFGMTVEPSAMASKTAPKATTPPAVPTAKTAPTPTPVPTRAPTLAPTLTKTSTTTTTTLQGSMGANGTFSWGGSAPTKRPVVEAPKKKDIAVERPQAKATPAAPAPKARTVVAREAPRQGQWGANGGFSWGKTSSADPTTPKPPAAAEVESLAAPSSPIQPAAETAPRRGQLGADGHFSWGGESI